MVFIVPADTNYLAFDFVGGPADKKQVLVPCAQSSESRRGLLLPVENACSLNVTTSQTATVPGPFRVEAGNDDKGHAHYRFAVETRSFVYTGANRSDD